MKVKTYVENGTVYEVKPQAITEGLCKGCAFFSEHLGKCMSCDIPYGVCGWNDDATKFNICVKRGPVNPINAPDAWTIVHIDGEYAWVRRGNANTIVKANRMRHITAEKYEVGDRVRI